MCAVVYDRVDRVVKFKLLVFSRPGARRSGSTARTALRSWECVLYTYKKLLSLFLNAWKRFTALAPQTCKNESVSLGKEIVPLSRRSLSAETSGITRDARDARDLVRNGSWPLTSTIPITVTFIPLLSLLPSISTGLIHESKGEKNLGKDAPRIIGLSAIEGDWGVEGASRCDDNMANRSLTTSCTLFSTVKVEAGTRSSARFLVSAEPLPPCSCSVVLGPFLASERYYVVAHRRLAAQFHRASAEEEICLALDKDRRERRGIQISAPTLCPLPVERVSHSRSHLPFQRALLQSYAAIVPSLDLPGMASSSARDTRVYVTVTTLFVVVSKLVAPASILNFIVRRPVPGFAANVPNPLGMKLVLGGRFCLHCGFADLGAPPRLFPFVFASVTLSPRASWEYLPRYLYLFRSFTSFRSLPQGPDIPESRRRTGGSTTLHRHPQTLTDLVDQGNDSFLPKPLPGSHYHHVYLSRSRTAHYILRLLLPPASSANSGSLYLRVYTSYDTDPLLRWRAAGGTNARRSLSLRQTRTLGVYIACGTLGVIREAPFNMYPKGKGSAWGYTYGSQRASGCLREIPSFEWKEKETRDGFWRFLLPTTLVHVLHSRAEPTNASLDVRLLHPGLKQP
ncbi:hypothetical protein NMY22_g17461 [Coprinellus aureogranulatus]|nr:hypothetical protein NMY22_g17461 [Coprinellus aureogranulatus]